MKAFYHVGKNWRSMPKILAHESSMLALSYNNWDDYGAQTTLNAVLYVRKESVLDFSLKIFIRDVSFTAEKLNELREKGWDGFFPIPNLDYVSVPNDIKFYDALLSKIGRVKAEAVLVNIRDAGYLTQIVGDENAINLVQAPGFDSSALREGGSRKSYEDGWAIFTDTKSSIRDFKLYVNAEGGPLKDPISFKFNSTTLPYDINVLIGPNGIGKSHTIKKLVEYWLGVDVDAKDRLEGRGHKAFDKAPNISKLILVSYSPFEDFEVDLAKSNLKDKDAYKYFGFRKKNITAEGKTRISISRNLPAADSINSICKAYSDDKEFSYLNHWIGKVDAITDVLAPALGFDHMALELTSGAKVPEELSNRVSVFGKNEKRHLKIDKRTLTWIRKELDNGGGIRETSGVVFLNAQGPLELSSGQRLFCYIVINVVGSIEKDSLIIVDEPELFLHPTLEIEFVSLLKKVLAAFDSKAILATHSPTIAREAPAKCMHVYRRSDRGVEVDPPPFETFGGDIQRISSYVFGDNKVSKPFAEWVNAKIMELGSKDELLESLKDEINYELLIRIKNSKVLHGR